MRLAVIFAKLKATDRSTLFATRRNFGPNPYSRRSSAIWRTSFVDFAEPSRSRPAGLLVKAERAVKLGDFSSVANNLADPVAFNVAFDNRLRSLAQLLFEALLFALRQSRRHIMSAVALLNSRISALAELQVHGSRPRAACIAGLTGLKPFCLCPLTEHRHRK